jgi:ParB-like chromosome segregation protein Spo0J
MATPKAPTEQQVTTTTSNLPEYAQPYYERMLNTAEGLTLGGEYTPYGGQRVAGFNPSQNQAFSDISGMETPGEFGAASGLATQAGIGSLLSNYDPSQFSAQNVYGPNLTNYNMATPGQFGDAQASQYMSPYIQNVIDVTKNRAILDADKTQLAEDLGAARQGTYGGSRQLLAALGRERNLTQNLSDIETQGLQSAYENAQAQYERDRAASMGADQANLQANLGVQQLGANNWMQSMLANQQTGLEAQRLGEQSRQFGAGFGLQGLGQAGDMAQTLSNIGTGQQQADAQRLGMQLEAGGQQQAVDQQSLDLAYSDFLRQRDYPLEMLGYYNSLLRGLPLTPNSTTTTYAPPPSMGSQLLGTGLGALGMYKSLSG